MTTPLLVTITCNYCSQFFDPREAIRIGESVVMCPKCRETHIRAVEGFNPPDFCVGCRRTWEQLKGNSPGTHVSMFAAWRDGEYTLLCLACDLAYVQKRKDLYGNTRHGWEQKIK